MCGLVYCTFVYTFVFWFLVFALITLTFFVFGLCFELMLIALRVLLFL